MGCSGEHARLSSPLALGHSPEDSCETNAICWDLKDAVDSDKKASRQGDGHEGEGVS